MRASPLRVRRLPMRKPSANSTARRLMILACFSPNRPVLTSQQIADTLALLPLTIDLLVAPLVRHGWIIEDVPGAYRLGSSQGSRGRR
jgi:DNA-binding IclR family transcriptional regulator